MGAGIYLVSYLTIFNKNSHEFLANIIRNIKKKQIIYLFLLKEQCPQDMNDFFIIIIIIIIALRNISEKIYRTNFANINLDRN